MSVRIARKLEGLARSTWANPVGKAAIVGGIAAGGALVVGWIFGPAVASRGGAAAGEGFAHGMEHARREMAGLLERGSRFG